ncbi:MAG: TonB-dependent receptor [Acidobacteriota bacterium]
MRIKLSQSIFALCLCVLLGSLTIGHAQAVKGSLLGTITDANGAAAAGATVTITETRTNISATTAANSDGNYAFPNVKDGVYRIEATQQGFKKVVRENVVVDVNTTVRVDLNLPVGQVTESITIEAGAPPLLQTDRADTGRLLESKQVSELPLGFNRNFQGLLITVPGATRPSRPHSQFFNSQDSLESKVNGQSRLSNNFMIEGVDDNQKTGLLQVLIPAADAIETVSISTSNFDAEFGRAGGAVSSVTLKSGTNNLHGSAFLFGNNNNGWLQAGNYFTHTTAPTHYRQVGATIGGPIIKNKLFYFGDYQYTTDALGTVFRYTSPYPEWFGGDFRNSPTKIYDPRTGNADGTDRQQISCNGVLNVICADRISPVALKLLNFLKSAPPNIPNAPFNTPNSVFNEVLVKKTHSMDAKINYNLSEKNVLSYRFSYQRPEVTQPGPYGVYGGPNSGGGFDGIGTQNIISTAGNYTRTFNPTLILEARFGITWYHNVATTAADGLKTSADVGIPGVNLDNFTSGLTTINIGGFTGPVLGFVNSLPWDRGEKTYLGSAIVTKLLGNHSIKVGEEIRHNRDFLLQVQDQGGVRGQFTFNSQRAGRALTDLTTGTQPYNDAVAANNGPANAFASFLLDAPGGYSRDLVIIDQPGTQQYNFFTFIQDNWQVSQKLTLNLGLRHERYTPLRGLIDKGGLSNYNPLDNTELVAGYGNVSQSVGVEGTWRNFAIRSGASYRLNDKTVIRGGYGETIIPFPDNSYTFNFPVKQNNQFVAANAFAPIGSLATGFATPTTFDIPSSGIIDGNLPILKNSSLYYAPPDLREGKLHSYNVAFQRELPWNFAAEVAYVGNVGRGILATLNLNAATQLGQALPGNDNAARPLFQKFGRTTDVNTRIRTGTNYNSLQIKVDRRFSKGLLVTSNYTLSRAITESDDDNGGIGTPADPTLSRGRAGFDRTHSFNSTFVWELPFAKQTSGFVKAALDGWQITGIATVQSGTPLDFTTNGTDLHAPGNTQRPNLIGEIKVLGQYGAGLQYLSPAAGVFETPAATLTNAAGVKYSTFGNLTRNSTINGPGYWNLDSSIFKKFRFTERFGGEIRADVFNIFNHPNFANPNTSIVSPTFGQVTSVVSGSRLVRFGARVTF